MFKNTFLAALLATVVNAQAQTDSAATCRKCFDGGGRQCITSGGGVTFYDAGSCCLPGDTSTFCTKAYG
jgi:hypothetical protein